MGRTIFTMTDEKIGPITEQPEAKPEGAEIIPGPSANANGKWAAPLNPCGNPMACLKVYFCLPCTIRDVGSYSGMNACLACCCYGYVRKFILFIKILHIKPFIRNKLSKSESKNC